MDAIRVSSLVKHYGTVQALRGVSFSVPEGEIFGYLGPNGAGKTTTIRILTGITPPTSGRAEIFGHDIVEETRLARSCMGIVPEISNIYDDLTAWRNLCFAGELYGVGRRIREERAEELLRRFGLLDRRDHRVRTFSRGMKRRLTIAMGMVHSPRILFLDEPTSGLDVQSQLIIREVIREQSAADVTIFLTTHNIEEANQMCDRVAIIHRGIVAAIDSPERLKHTIQKAQSVEIALPAFPPGIAETLRSLAGVNELRKEGERFRLYTEDPSQVLVAAMATLAGMGIAPLAVNTLGPSLEDVFIRLTGIGAEVNAAQQGTAPVKAGGTKEKGRSAGGVR